LPKVEAEEQETEAFYEDSVQTIQKHKKSGECLIILGDLKEKMGTDSEEDLVNLFIQESRMIMDSV
jgi:hypothetical protein